MALLWLGSLMVFVYSLARLEAWVLGQESLALCKTDHRRISHLDRAPNQFEVAHQALAVSRNDLLRLFWELEEILN